MKKDDFAEINENGINLSDFSIYDDEHILNFSAEFVKHNNTSFFTDERLKDIDIYIHVIFYDGYNNELAAECIRMREMDIRHN